MKCEYCKNRIKVENPAYINGRISCQKCFVEHRKGKRIYKLNLKRTKTNIELIKMCRARLTRKGSALILQND